MSLRNLSELWLRQSSPRHATLKSVVTDGLLVLVGLIGWVSIASAQGGPKKAEPPHITNAEIKYDTNPPEIWITGENLKDDLQDPAVFLGGVQLEVPVDTPSNDKFVVVYLRSMVGGPLVINPGDHLLVLDSRVADTRPTEFMLTFGATGPQGPKGDPGEPGATGAKGDKGDTGLSCSASETETGALIDCDNGTFATLRDGVDGSSGANGADGAPGPQGPAGLACWDLDGNGARDVATEDFNGDGIVDVNDCKGDQIINLTVEIPQVPDLVPQDFITVFPDTAKSTTSVEMFNFACDAVIVNGPGLEIDVVPGFRPNGLSDNQSGLSTELPLVLEFFTEEQDGVLYSDACADSISSLLTSTAPQDLAVTTFLTIITKTPSGEERVRWQMGPLRPTSEQPAFDGRRRFVFEVTGETAPLSTTPIPNPNHLVAIQRQTTAVIYGPSLNLATDRAVEIAGIDSGYPVVEEDDRSTNRLVLVYDFVEAAPIFDYAKFMAELGTLGAGKRDVSTYSVNESAVEMPGTRRNYFGCFPIRWEQFAGFSQVASLKERLTLQCDYSEPVL